MALGERQHRGLLGLTRRVALMPSHVYRHLHVFIVPASFQESRDISFCHVMLRLRAATHPSHQIACIDHCETSFPRITRTLAAFFNPPCRQSLLSVTTCRALCPGAVVPSAAFPERLVDPFSSALPSARRRFASARHIHTVRRGTLSY